MAKQKRYTSEEQITASIDRLRELERKDLWEMDRHNCAIQVLRIYPDKVHDMNYHKGQVEILEKRIARRASSLERMKQKLAEFRTLTFSRHGRHHGSEHSQVGIGDSPHFLRIDSLGCRFKLKH